MTTPTVLAKAKSKTYGSPRVYKVRVAYTVKREHDLEVKARSEREAHIAAKRATLRSGKILSTTIIGDDDDDD